MLQNSVSRYNTGEHESQNRRTDSDWVQKTDEIRSKTENLSIQMHCTFVTRYKYKYLLSRPPYWPNECVTTIVGWGTQQIKKSLFAVPVKHDKTVKKFLKNRGEAKIGQCVILRQLKSYKKLILKIFRAIIA